MYLMYNETTGEIGKAYNIPVQGSYIEIDEDKYNTISTDGNKYFVSNGELTTEETDGYKTYLEEVERERLDSLTLTKRIFALALKEYCGISYSTLKELIATNEDAQLEWDLCSELLRGNSLLDTMAEQMNITSAQLDYIFQKANGEDV